LWRLYSRREQTGLFEKPKSAIAQNKAVIEPK
jgi:hypothetical protein